MIDFLRANTWCSMNDYLWGMTIPQIKLASHDYSHVEYLASEEEKKKRQKDNDLIGRIPMV